MTRGTQERDGREEGREGGREGKNLLGDQA